MHDVAGNEYNQNMAPIQFGMGVISPPGAGRRGIFIDP